MGAEYSMVSAAATGMMPPMPRPPIRRKSPNSSGVGAHAAPAWVRVKMAIEASSIFLRPTRSLSVPMNSAPISIPIKA